MSAIQLDARRRSGKDDKIGRMRESFPFSRHVGSWQRGIIFNAWSKHNNKVENLGIK
jgi:hypothetical protein